MPDDYIAALIPKLRHALHLASDLEARYSYKAEICSIEPNERDADEGDDTFEREYKLSGHVLHFVELFRRFAQLHPEQAAIELRSWPTSETIFRRLKIWGLGNLELVPATEFASELIAVDDDAFWPFKGNRDLLLGLSKRWPAFSKDERLEIGKAHTQRPPEIPATRKRSTSPPFSLQHSESLVLDGRSRM